MKTAFAVLFVGLFASFCLSAAPTTTSPHSTSMNCPFVDSGVLRSIPFCPDLSDPLEQKICSLCAQVCAFQYADIMDDYIDTCFTTCIYDVYAVLYVGSGPVSREIPDKRDAALLDGLPLSHVRIQTPRF